MENLDKSTIYTQEYFFLSFLHNTELRKAMM